VAGTTRCPVCRSRRVLELAEGSGTGSPSHECRACGHRWRVVVIIDGPLAFLTPWLPREQIEEELREAAAMLADTSHVLERFYRGGLRMHVTEARHILAGTWDAYARRRIRVRGKRFTYGPDDKVVVIPKEGSEALHDEVKRGRVATRTRPRRCPACGSRAVLRIQYGYPAPGMLEAEKAGKLVLGGCVIEDGQPRHACGDCGHEW